MDRIILASQSPRRKQLLEWAGVDFDIMVSDADESYPADLKPDEIPIFIARNKAQAIFDRMPTDKIILAADTIVVLKGEVLGKPADRTDAIEILSKISGKKHDVITGVVIRKGTKEITFSDSTEVWFHELSQQQIEYYVDHYSPFDKAGAYAIQEWIGVVGIQRVNGDFYNVMGLPVSRVYRALQGLLG